MKNNGKRMGLAGTIIVLLLYIVLQWTGIIQPKGDESQESTQYRQITESSESMQEPESNSTGFNDEPASNYEFRNQKLENNHYEKHGVEMGFDTVEDYIAAANKVIDNPDSLHKLEAEDNDHVYFLEETNEFVILSQDGYIRTYYIANGGIDYFNRQ